MKVIRDPSLHIKKSDLDNVLRKILGISKTKEILDELMVEASKYTVTSRSITISNQYEEKKVKKIALSDKDDNLLMANCIWAYRTGKLKHRGIRKINQDSKEWGEVKELTSVVNQFYEDYHNHFSTKREAYLEYLSIGFKNISSTYGLLRKLINMSESISNHEYGKIRLSEDKDPELTKAIHDYYCGIISSKTGMDIDYEKSLDKYYKFLEVRLLCEEKDIDYDVYIDAQFESLSFRNGVPELSQLIGDKAMERFNKYIFENRISYNKKSNKSYSSQLKKLKNIK